jgi:hypothetical protein
MRNMLVPAAISIALLVGVAPQKSHADTYTEVTFTGGINPGNANVQPPFAGNGFTQGDTLSGTFVFDNQLVPGPASGLDNIFFQNFPNIIPAASAFTLNLDGLHFNGSNDLTTDLPAGIQYDNGHFNGLEFITDFAFQGSEYQFRIDGGAITTELLDSAGNPTGGSLINGFINLGDANLTHPTPFTPTPTPIPASLGLFAAALAALALILRRQQGPPVPLAA